MTVPLSSLEGKARMRAIVRHFVGACALGALVSAGLAASPRPDAPKSTPVGWRGDGSGHYAKAQTPTEWDVDDGKNILWHATVGKSHSSPAVVGDRVVLTAESSWLVCVDRKSGKVLWKQDHSYARLLPAEKRPKKPPPAGPGGGYAIPTPVTDGKSVYVSYGTGMVVCCDLAGKRRWARFIDLPQVTQFGRSASPLLVDGKLLVSIGGLIALDPKTGKTLWKQLGAKCGYGTPAVARIGDVTLAVTPNGDLVRVSDGRLMASKLAQTGFTSPVVHAGVVYFADDPTVAVRLTAKPGGKIQTRKLWEAETEGEFHASPLWHDGKVYCISSGAVLYVLDAKTGEIAFQKKLEIASADPAPGMESANIYPSIARIGKHLLVSNDQGCTLVLAPGEKCKQVSVNYLDGGSGACPVPDGKLLFLRAGKKLYCIGRK